MLETALLGPNQLRTWAIPIATASPFVVISTTSSSTSMPAGHSRQKSRTAGCDKPGREAHPIHECARYYALARSYIAAALPPVAPADCAAHAPLS